jgi:group I intron endonuclease
MSIYHNSTGIIYCYTNTITGKKYIGQTIHPEQRKRSHLHEAMVRDSDYYFHRSIRKHGWENFEYEVLEEVDREILNERENHYINQFNTLWPYGYNQCLANSLDEKSIQRMSETKKKKFAMMTEEERREYTRKMWEANKGSKRSEETKKKMSESVKKYLKENPRTKIIWTQEMKDKQSRLLKEKYNNGIGRWAKKEGP